MSFEPADWQVFTTKAHCEPLWPERGHWTGAHLWRCPSCQRVWYTDDYRKGTP